ncbi:hypothetical protein Tco_1573824 [Tanacetum coccineum]
MSTPAHFDSEIISQIDGAQSSQVPIPLSDDHYMAVRQSHLVDTDTEFGPLKDLRETKIPHPLPSAPSLVPPLDNLYLIVRQTHTPATIDTKSEPKEAPLEIEEYRSSYETSSPSSSLTFPIQKRYQGTSELVEDTEDESLNSDTEREGLEDEGPGSEDGVHGSEDDGLGSEEEEEVYVRAAEGIGDSYIEATGSCYMVDPVDGTIYTYILVDVPPARVAV